MEFPFTELVEEIKKELIARKYKIGTAESCTGGRYATSLTSVSGISEVLEGGIVSYSNEIKMSVLGVKKETIDTYTVVSEQVCKEMLEGCKRVLKVNCSVASTGYASDAPNHKDNLTGLIYVGASVNDKVKVAELHMTGTREENVREADKKGLELMLELLKSL